MGIVMGRVTGDHVIWSNHGFLGGKLMQRVAGLGLLILERVLFGSHSEPPVIAQNSAVLLSRYLTLAEIAGGYLSLPGGSEGEAQRPRP